MAKLTEQGLQDVRLLDLHMYEFYRSAVDLKLLGYTDYSFKWSLFMIKPKAKAEIERMLGHAVDMGPFDREYTLNNLKQMDPSLARCWEENC